MSDDTQDPDNDNILPFRTPQQADEDRRYENLNKFRKELFDLLHQGMENRLSLLDLVQALVDGATYVNILAHKENETSVEREIRLLVAQTQVALEKLQFEACGQMTTITKRAPQTSGRDLHILSPGLLCSRSPGEGGW